MLATAIERAQAMEFASQPVGLIDALQSPDINVWYEATEAISKLSKELDAAVIQDERFLGDTVRMLKTGHGAQGFYPNFIGAPLLIHAIKKGSPEAGVEWLQKIFETKEATGRTIQTLWGVPVTGPIDLTPNVRIVPINELPDSDQRRYLLQRDFRGNASSLATMLEHLPLESALVMERSISPLLYDPSQGNLASEDYIDTDTLLKEIALVLTVVGPRMAIPGLQWFEFDDPDFSLGRGYTTKILEVLPLRINKDPPLNAEEAKEIVGAYLALPAPARKLVRVALQRISQAMRRHNVGDAAVELSTAFEALLGDNGTSEMTHKIKVRSVRLIGGSDAIRKANATVMTKAYKIRSALVHTGQVGDGETETLDGERVSVREIIDRALLLCVELVKTIIRRGEIPNWSVFDITEQPNDT
jgi:Apea-like HEPN